MFHLNTLIRISYISILLEPLYFIMLVIFVFIKTFALKKPTKISFSWGFFNEETYRDAQSLKQMQLVYIYIYLCLYALHQNPIQRHLYILCFSRRDSCMHYTR